MQPDQDPYAAGAPPYGFVGCYRHPDRLTGVRCVRCNRPICPECQIAASVGFQCPDDVRAGRASQRAPRTLVGARVSGQVPVVSYLLIALNVLVYLATAVGQGSTLFDNTHSTLFFDFQMWPSGVARNHEYWRLITAAFLHIGPIHLLLNMYALYIVGPMVERLLGWWRFTAVYLLAALGGSVASLLLDRSAQTSAGASGAIFGLFAAALLLARVLRLDMRPLIITIAINFIFTFAVPGISKLGHIGGFVVGVLATLALLGWSLNRGRPSSRNIGMQVAGLAGILVLMAALSIWRISYLTGHPLS